MNTETTEITNTIESVELETSVTWIDYLDLILKAALVIAVVTVGLRL